MRKISRNEQGFTLVEAVVVVGIILVLVGFSMLQSFGSIQSYRANSAMDIVAGQLRVARQLAISQRRTVQVWFDVNTVPPAIRYQVQPRLGVAADVPGPMITMPLPAQTNYLLENGVPDTPMNFGTCAGASPVCIAGVGGGLPTMIFTSTGQFGADQFGSTVYNGTIFLGVPNQPSTARAVTIMGSTGRVRPYVYEGGSLGWQE